MEVKEEVSLLDNGGEASKGEMQSGGGDEVLRGRTEAWAQVQAEGKPKPGPEPLPSSANSANLRQRKKSSGRVHFDEQHLAELRRESMKKRAEKEAAAAVQAEIREGELTWGVAFVALLLARYFSAKSNIVHDCDEVFNYWEPLHYLLYKSGFQTWEYSSEFGLRSWLYIFLHAAVVKPATWLYGADAGKVEVFYLVRFILGMVSASSEAALVAGTASVFGKRIAAYTLVLLSFTSGLYAASTSFFPSTFSMYAVTLTAAALLFKRPTIAVTAAVVGVILGWPFSGLATVPLILYAIATGGFVPMFLTGLITSVSTLVVSAAVDRLFYGRWMSSVLNLVLYNVFGGGDSAIFGVEGPMFYLRNGFNNFNIALPLALLFPLLALVKSKKYGLLLAIVSPVYLWLGFMSLQAHKEERFLYPVYPLICLAAAAVLEAFPDLVPKSWNPSSDEDSVPMMVAKLLRPLTLALILCLSYSRTASILYGYSAPLQVYRQLPQLVENHSTGGAGGGATDGVSTVCVGAEWHRFPSSFFLPSPAYEVRWLDDGEKGLLPLPFNDTLGGTASAPPYFNKHNRASTQQFLETDGTCNFLVELKLERPERRYRGDDPKKWQVVWKQPYLDNERSPALHRAIFVPWLWQERNTFGSYRLLRQNVTSPG